jgi:hypothetical protein
MIVGLLLGGLPAFAQDATRPPAPFDAPKKATVKPLKAAPVPNTRPGPPSLNAMPAIIQAQAKAPLAPMPGGPQPLEAETRNPQIQLAPPGPDRLFGQLESESAWKERMRQEAMEVVPAERISFPEEPILTSRQYHQREFPPLSEVVEPGYVVYRRLYFEQKNFERAGWDLGYITPFVSAGAFFWDIATFPYHVGTQPLRKWDTGAGNCLPGNPSPLLLYPPEFSVTGALSEAAVVVSLFALFPGP